MRARLLVLVALAGCGSGPSATQACTQVAQARCMRQSVCSAGAAIVRGYGDLATCVAREQLACTLQLTSPDSGGSPLAVQQCALAIANEACADLFGNDPPPECVTRGRRGTGAPCAFGGQCASTYCLADKIRACGTCGDAPPSGIACDATSCARGLICTARTQTCQKPALLGDACDNDTRLCAADLSCNLFNGATSSTCAQSIATTGAACGPGVGGCDGTRGLTCTAKKCVAIDYAGDGAPCGNFTIGGFGGCGEGGSCYTATGVAQLGEMGVCRAAAKDGQPCDNVLGPPCLAPARCVVSGVGSAGVCTLPSGASCG